MGGVDAICTAGVGGNDETRRIVGSASGYLGARLMIMQAMFMIRRHDFNPDSRRLATFLCLQMRNWL